MIILTLIIILFKESSSSNKKEYLYPFDIHNSGVNVYEKNVYETLKFLPYFSKMFESDSCRTNEFAFCPLVENNFFEEIKKNNEFFSMDENFIKNIKNLLSKEFVMNPNSSALAKYSIYHVLEIFKKNYQMNFLINFEKSENQQFNAVDKTKLIDQEIITFKFQIKIFLSYYSVNLSVVIKNFYQPSYIIFKQNRNTKTEDQIEEEILEFMLNDNPVIKNLFNRENNDDFDIFSKFNPNGKYPEGYFLITLENKGSFYIHKNIRICVKSFYIKNLKFFENKNKSKEVVFYLNGEVLKKMHFYFEDYEWRFINLEECLVIDTIEFSEYMAVDNIYFSSEILIGFIRKGIIEEFSKIT